MQGANLRRAKTRLIVTIAFLAKLKFMLPRVSTLSGVSARLVSIAALST